MDEKQRLLQLIAALEARLADLKKRLPAHSIPPAMLLELDQLDEQLSAARQQLNQLAETEGEAKAPRPGRCRAQSRAA